MTPPASTDKTAAKHAKRWTVEQFFIDLTKVVTALVLVVVVLGLVLLGLTLQPNWQSSSNVSIEPYGRADTTITIHADGCEEVRFNVQEQGDEIRVSAEYQPISGGACQFYTKETLELDEPIGSRQIVNADTDQPLG